jgi:translocation and assembly module TamB
MKAAKSKRRKLLVRLGLATGFVVALVAALPIWFRWALRPVLQTYGIRFESYEPVGYTKFALSGIRGEWKNVRFESPGVEAFLPTRWLWSFYFNSGDQDLNVEGGPWRLVVEPDASTAPERDKAPGSTSKVLNNVEAILIAVRNWVPTAQFTNGVLQIHSQVFTLPLVHWKQGSLNASVRPARFAETVALHASVSTNSLPFISLRAPETDVTIKAQLKRAADHWDLVGETQWLTNRMVSSATFVQKGWLPERARLQANSVQLPASRLNLPNYEDLSGSFALEWVKQRFTLNATAAAQPKTNSIHQLPPVALVLAAHGDEQVATVENFKLTSPGIGAELSGKVSIDRSGNVLTNAASLKVFLDLAELPGTLMTGRLQGLVRLRPSPTNSFHAAFEMSGKSLSSKTLEVSEATANGELSWPALDIKAVVLKLADSSSLTGSARVDLRSRIVTEGRWNFDGLLPPTWQPKGMSSARLETAGSFGGSMTNLTHSGQLAIRALSIPPFSPCGVQANWRGEKFDLSEAEIQFDAGDSYLRLGGALRISDSPNQSSSIALNKLTFQRDGQIFYGLEQPCAISFRHVAGTNSRTEVKLDALHWAGAERKLQLAGEIDWPRRGRIRSQSLNVRLDDFTDFLPRAMRRWSVNNLDVKADWDDGPVTLDLTTRIDFASKDGGSFSTQGGLRTSLVGIEAERVRVSSAAGNVVSIDGTLPITLIPGSTNGWLHLDQQNPINLRAVTTPNKTFWDGLTDVIGLRLENPALDLTLQGTLEKPEGVAYLKAERVQWKFASNNIAPPSLNDLQITASFEQRRVEVKTFTVELEGQPVRARGELPLTTDFWPRLITKHELPDWQQGSGRLEIVDARLDLFAKYLPQVLSPQGRLSLEAELKPGTRLSGNLEITNAATRPLGPLGRIHDIHAHIRLADRDARIEMFTGQVGGQSVQLTGSANLPDNKGVQFDVALRGTNVPLVRKPGVLVRTDLNVRVRQNGEQPTTISGHLNLRDSLFLQDLNTLVKGGPDQPNQRPPYFSVSGAPFDEWKVDVRIIGERFLRVRTPLFRGEISADFHLAGEMKEPVALGEVRIASGRVQFPFGTLNVDQGYAALTSENPYRPRLFVLASGRTYGHEIKMEVSGLANEPRLTFNSTPPLTSEQIVMLLTAGELPQEELSLSGQQRAARLAMFVGKDFLGRLIGDEGTAERLTIRSGEEISDESQQSYYLEYRLTDAWSVVGEYDRFNALNVGLKWKIFSK